MLVDDASAVASAGRVVESELASIDEAASRFRPDSELSRLHRSGGESRPVSGLLSSALATALWAAEVTGGDLDPTIGRSLRTAGYDRDFAAVAPTGPALATAQQPAPGWTLVELDAPAGTVRIPDGVEVDLGATAKALAVDRAAAAAHHLTGAAVLVSVGGDLAVAGPSPAEGWVVRVTDDHRSSAGPPGQTVSVSDGGLATSTTAVRRWTRGSRALHHIIDPRTGEPATGPWRTVSVAARSCVDANVASTAAVIRGESAVGWLEELRLPSRLVAVDGRVVTVAGWPAPGPEPALA